MPQLEDDMDSQCQLIRQALEAGRVLTWQDIYRLAGCINHKGRISDLRKQGMDIPRDHCVLIKSQSQRGWKRIGIYYDGNQMDYEEAFKRFNCRDSKSLSLPETPSKPRKHSDKGFIRDLPERTVNGKFSGKQTVDEDVLGKAIQLYRQGKTYREIGKILGYPWPTIYKRLRPLREAGVLKSRPPGQPRQLALEGLDNA